MKQKLTLRFISAAALCLALIFTSCTNFDSAWRKAATRKPSHDLSGRWEGRWISTRNGHNGALRAIITPDGANNFHALFHATYGSVLTFTYPVMFETTRHGSSIEFCGTSDLPAWAGGRYTSNGHATYTDFTAIYKSKYDAGRFEMKRVAEQPAAH
jgi:hypothetical protein